MDRQEKLQKRFELELNALVFSNTDFDKLQTSYATDKSYAKEVLQAMHNAFITVYKTDTITDNMEFITVPAVIKGRKNGDICVGLVTLDAQSAGEHWMTTFLTKHGVTNQGDWDSDETLAFFREKYLPYDYFYTVNYEGDIHCDYENIPSDVAELLDFDIGQNQVQSM